MAAIKIESELRFARVFNPKEEGWSESMNLTLVAPVAGYEVNKETGEKVAGQVDAVSFFIGDVVKALSHDADVSAFLVAKTKEERLQLLPVLLAGAKMIHTAEDIADEKKMLRNIEKIVITPVMLSRVQKALDQLFGF